MSSGNVNTDCSSRRPGQRILSLLIAVVALCAFAEQCLWAVEIWNGPSVPFTNLSGSDPNDAANQDRITANVWLVRGAIRGLYNAANESGYAHSYSPAGTAWAYGQLANYNSLIYQNWEAWNGAHPPNMVGQDAVLHILPGDIYLAIQFTSWGVGSGGFSYTRSTQFAPEPSCSVLILAGLMARAGVAFCRRRDRRVQKCKT